MEGHESKAQQIKKRMTEIRNDLDRMAIEQGDLRWEYLQLNQELGRIEQTPGAPDGNA
jgi:archaellum component FlaC